MVHVDATRAIGRRSLAALLALLVLVGVSAPAYAAPAETPANREPLTSKGTDFWLAFPLNHPGSGQFLFLSGDVATSGTVSAPGLGWSAPFTITPGQVTTVNMPAGIEVAGNDIVENKGFRVQSQHPITVYGLNRVQYSTDAFLGYPVAALGMEYVTLTYATNSQFVVVGAEDNTTVTIRPSFSAGSRTAGTPYTVTLQQGQTYRLFTAGEGSGTRVTSDKPVALYSGATITNVPAGTSAADHAITQVPPVDTWGTSFASMQLMRRTGGDRFRILASENDTEVRVNGDLVATLAANAFHEQVITGPAHITTTKPALVAQFAHGVSYDGTTGDPMMMLLPGTEQYLNRYTLTTPASGFDSHHVNIVTTAAAVGTIAHNGTLIPAGEFVSIGGGMWGTRRQVATGVHNFDSILPFGVFVYGFTNADAYGYPGGQAFSPIGSVATVSPPPGDEPQKQAGAGDEVCSPVLVLDSEGNGVEGIRVDYVVTGANPQSGFAYSDEDGLAQWCYTGEQAGEDHVEAKVASYETDWTVTWEAVAPGTPRTVVATGGAGEIGLSWSAPASTGGGTISGYVVEYRADGGEWATYDTVVGTSATVGDLDPSTLYEFRIAAVNEIGTGDFGETVSASTWGPPSAPRTVETQAGNGAVTLTWQTPAADGGGTISGYVVEYRTEGGEWATYDTVAGTSTTVSGLDAATSYEFRVAAVNDTGTGVASDVVTTRTWDVPGSTRDHGVTTGLNMLALRWEAPEADGGTAVTGYAVEYRVAGGEWTSHGTVAGTSVTIDELAPATAYEIRVAAVNAVGTAAWHVVETSTWRPATPPRAATLVPGDGVIAVTWDAPNDNGGTPVMGYVVEYRAGDGEWVTHGTVMTPGATLEGLEKGTAYEVRVSAVTSAGTGTPVVATVATWDVPAAPAKPSGAASAAGAITVSWIAPGADGGSPVTGYVVEYRTGGGEWVTHGTVEGTSATLTGLPKGTAYEVRVSAVTDVGTGPAAGPISVTTWAQPAAPAGLTVVPGGSSATLTWGTPATTGGGPVTGYLVEYQTEGGEWVVYRTVEGTGVTVTGLRNGTGYRFRVSAITAAGTGAPLTSAAVTPKTNPATPGTVKVTAGEQSLTVTWTVPGDTGGSPVTGYKIRLEPGGRVIEVPASASPYTITGLDPSVSYTVSVAAISAGGTSPWKSSGSTVKPQPKPEPTPEPAPEPKPNGVERVHGKERTETAQQLSQKLFAPGVDVVYIVHRDRFADGLAGGPAAAAQGAPILLTDLDRLPASTIEELQRLNPGRIVILGGTGVVSPEVEQALSGYTEGEVDRIGGADRYETSAMIAAQSFEPGVPVVYVATGADFADSLSGGPAASLHGGPVLLVQRDGIPDVVARELKRLAPRRIVVLGGTAAVSADVEAALADHTEGEVVRLWGRDRFATSAAVTKATFPGTVDVVYIATGGTFPDALAATPAAHVEGAALLLVGSHTIPAQVAAELERLAPERITVLGGSAAVSEQVFDQLAGYLR